MLSAGCVGAVIGRTMRRGFPPTTRPIGPVLGEATAPGLALCILQTCLAAWISSAITTTHPTPDRCSAAAVWTAAKRFAGPAQDAENSST